MTECPDADIGVVGEGELTFKNLLDALHSKQDLSQCRGIIYRASDELVQTEPGQYVEDLDTLPFPARNLIRNFDSYHHHFLRQSGSSVSMITSRGCPCRCAFCTQAVFGSRPRGHSPAYVCDEIELVKKEFGLSFISFEDDTFNFSRRRLRELCELMIQKDLNVEWGCSIRVDFMDEDDARLMHRAGCRKIYIGVESFCKRIQKMIHKEYDETVLLEKIRMVRALGMDVNASFMIGFPTETRKEILHTVKRVSKFPIDGAFFCLYTPYPGTPMREQALENGVVSSNWDDYSNHLSTHSYYPDSISTGALDRLLFYAYMRFYFDPNRLRRNLLNIDMYKQLFKP